MGCRMNVFVYGTLRKGERNAYHLNDETCLHEQAWVNGSLYDTERGYPVIFLNKDGDASHKVYGEIYDINDKTLKVLDDLEGFVPGNPDNLYERTHVTAYTDQSGTVEDVITYVAGNTLKYAERNISLGDWNVYNYFQKQDLYYFAYGSCMDDERFKQANVEKHFTDVVGRGVLKGYCMTFSRSTDDGGKADIIECENKVVEGVIYRVNMKAIEYLYHREGVYSNGHGAAVVAVSSGQDQYRVLTSIGLGKKQVTPAPDLYATEISRGAAGVLSVSDIEQVEDRIAKLNEMQSHQ